MFAGMTVLVFVGAALMDSAAMAQQPGRYRDQDSLTQQFIRENFPIEVTRGIGGAERYASGDRRDIFANLHPYPVPKEKGVPARPSLFRGVAVHDEEPLVPKSPVYPQTREILPPIGVAIRPLYFGKDGHQEEEDGCIGPQDSPGYCVPLVRCPHLFLTSTIGKAIRAGSPDAYCPLGYGGIGVCCPPVRSEEKKPIRMSEVFPVFEDGGLDARLLPKADVDKAVVTGINKADEFGVISRALLESGQVIPPRSPGKANQAFLQANEDAYNLSNIALQQIAIAQELQKSG